MVSERTEEITQWFDTLALANLPSHPNKTDTRRTKETDTERSEKKEAKSTCGSAHSFVFALLSHLRLQSTSFYSYIFPSFFSFIFIYFYLNPVIFCGAYKCVATARWCPLAESMKSQLGCWADDDASARQVAHAFSSLYCSRSRSFFFSLFFFGKSSQFAQNGKPQINKNSIWISLLIDENGVHVVWM